MKPFATLLVKLTALLCTIMAIVGNNKYVNDALQAAGLWEERRGETLQLRNVYVNSRSGRSQMASDMGKSKQAGFQ